MEAITFVLTLGNYAWEPYGMPSFKLKSVTYKAKCFTAVLALWPQYFDFLANKLKISRKAAS